MGYESGIQGKVQVETGMWESLDTGAWMRSPNRSETLPRFRGQEEGRPQTLKQRPILAP